MKPVIDLSREYGLVLEGGGAKGAYQIGACKALLEAGVKIKGVSGTSVGALNGALICMGDMEKAQQIWESISYSQVMDVNDTVMKKLLSLKLKPGEFLEYSLNIIKNGGLDVTPLRQLIEEVIDEEAIRRSSMDFFVQTFCVSDFQELHVDMKEIEEDTMKDMLLASAYMFPVFKTEKLRGKTYIDGGISDNVPIDALLEKDYKDIIMIRIYGIGVIKPVKVPEDVQVITIAPRADLGNIMDFDPEKSRKNLIIGYFDAMREIYGLKGRVYYLDDPHDPDFYLNRLISMRGQEENIRRYVEKVLPRLALELRLGPEWDYDLLYLSMLEASARILKVPKYRIYTVEELQIAVKENSFKEMEQEPLPKFVQMIINS